MDSVWLCLASSTSWLVSTMTGCGSPVVLIPLVGYFLGVQAVAPVLTIGMLMGNSQRIALYWKDIDRGGGGVVFTRCLHWRWLGRLGHLQNPNRMGGAAARGRTDPVRPRHV